MARNRRKHTNPLPVGALARWVVGLFFLMILGLSYVAFKNQMHVNGGAIDKLERELTELKTQNEVVRARISSLSSRMHLQRRLDSGFISMVEITPDRIVRLDHKTIESGGEPAIRAVANERVAQ